MIPTAEVIPLLLQACPSFAEQWEESLRYNADDEVSGGRLNYQDASDFVRHLVDLKVAESTAEFPAVFAVLELLLTEGDPDVRNLAAIGYIEDLQGGIVQGNDLSPEQDIRPWLGPRAEAAWEQVNRMWAGEPYEACWEAAISKQPPSAAT